MIRGARPCGEEAMAATARRPLAAVCAALLLCGCAGGAAPRAGSSEAAPPPPIAAAPAAPTSEATAVPTPTHVRFATQFASAGIPIYLALDRGYFQQEGIDPELVPFSSNSEMVPSLSTNRVEAGGVSVNAAMWNAVARGVQLKVVLDHGSFRPGQASSSLVIRKDLYDAGRGHTLDDLRGLNLVNTPPGKATTNFCAMAAGLRRAGVSPDDVGIQPLPFPDMVPALANGAIDGALLAEPFVTHARRQGTIVRVMGQDAMYPYFSVNVVGFSLGLYENRPAARGFVRAYLRAVRDYQATIEGRAADADRAPIDESIARYTRIDLDTVREMAPVGFSPNGLPNLDSILYCYPFFRELGAVPEPVSESATASLWDLELVEEVLDEVGRLPES
jgi:NitT/TauT family transport system substrate-binding protein